MACVSREKDHPDILKSKLIVCPLALSVVRLIPSPLHSIQIISSWEKLSPPQAPTPVSKLCLWNKFSWRITSVSELVDVRNDFSTFLFQFYDMSSEVSSSSRAQQMLNNSSQKPQIIFPILTISTKWACDPENINIHYGVGGPGDVIVEPTLATGALSSRVRHSSRAAHKLNYLNIRTTFDV